MNYETGSFTEWSDRRKVLVEFQKALIQKFGEADYNVFVYGSFIRSDFEDGRSDIDMIVYCQNREKQWQIYLFCEDYFRNMNLPADVIEYRFIERAFIFPYAILSSVRMTDYYPEQLKADLYVILHGLPEYREEQKQKKKYFRWKNLLLKSRQGMTAGEVAQV
ncbi:MAG: nucleotidyltransferase domain-containing protein [Lachnospiraceae bacterium]|nr:nucleotidyltransferase domain-containing protein [Lachnospiraceae bacterium]